MVKHETAAYVLNSAVRFDSVERIHKLFYILMTVHLDTILVNNQLDALSLMYLFILPPYMFRIAQFSSSGDQLC